PEAQLKPPGGDFYMTAAQGRRAEALVRFRVTLVADADRAEVEQPHHARDRPLARQAAARQILGDPPARFRQPAAELGAAVELLRLLPAAEVRVVAVLLAPPRIDAGGKDMPARAWAEPRIGVRGRQRDPV